MVVQGVLTVVAEVAEGRVTALVALLAELDTALDEPGSNPLVDFRAVESVHFARLVVLPKNAAGKQHLALSTAYDGPKAEHLADLERRVGPGLAAVFAFCVGFPAGSEAASRLTAYLDAHSVRYGAMHVGYVGRTVLDVRREEALRRFIGGALDDRKISTLPSPGRSAQAIRREVIGIVKGSEFRWALEPRAAKISPTGVEGWWKNTAIAAGVVGALVGAGAVFAMAGQGVAYVLGLAGAASAFLGVLRWHEMHEPAKTDTDVAQGLSHADDEDFGVTNQLTHLVPLKPGAFRNVLLRTVLFAIELRARLQFYRGALGGIDTIHCAHWAILNEETPRLLFCSNYDGSWQRYLGDFIEEAGAGMTSVWSNTVNYPESEFLLWKGAKNELVFKAWTRESQVRTDVWYQANPDISCRNLNDNSRLRDGLSGYMSEADARNWLRLL